MYGNLYCRRTRLCRVLALVAHHASEVDDTVELGEVGSNVLQVKHWFKLYLKYIECRSCFVTFSNADLCGFAR